MATSKSRNRYAPLLLVLFLLIALFVVKQCFTGSQTATETTTKTSSTRGLDRNPAAIHYSKHARCRMDCRHISESEVKQVLKEGKINYAKSDLGNNPDCKRKYAVEGNTGDGQRVRIIFAPCAKEITVVTVIDLGKEWVCDCE